MSNKEEEFQKLEREKEELAKKEEEIKEKLIEGKIETIIKGAEVVAKAVDKFYFPDPLGIVEPVSAGMAGQAAAQAVQIIRNHEATEAYIKGVANEKVIEPVKEFIAHKFPEKDAAKEWGKDIAQKEHKLNDTHENQLKVLNDNNAMLVIQKIDLQKFPDAEKKLEQLKSLEETMEKEYKNIEEKFKNSKDELAKEKAALENAVIEASKYMNETKKQEVINGQRESFEQQQELERKRNKNEFANPAV